MDQIAKIDRWIGERSFVQAYYAVMTGLEAGERSQDFLEASRRLSSAIRSRCLDLASWKATEMSQEMFELEALLNLVIRLNREGIYG